MGYQRFGTVPVVSNWDTLSLEDLKKIRSRYENYHTKMREYESTCAIIELQNKDIEASNKRREQEKKIWIENNIKSKEMLLRQLESQLETYKIGLLGRLAPSPNAIIFEGSKYRPEAKDRKRPVNPSFQYQQLP